MSLAVSRTRDSDLAFISWFCALVSAHCAALLCAARAGLEGSPAFALLCVSILWAAVFAPFLIRDKHRRHDVGRAAAGLLSLLLLAGPLASFWIPREAFAIYPVLALAGTVRAWHRFQPTPMQTVSLLALPPLVALYVVITLQSIQTGVTLFAPEFAKLGWFRTDAYYHATAAYLYQIHGVFTLGLDGLDFPLRYHTGSHAWFAGLAAAVGSTPLFSYPLGHLVIVLPALLFSAGNFIVGASPASGAWIRLVVLVVTTLVLERVSMPHYYGSESYAVSLVAMTLALPLLFTPRPRNGDEGIAAYLPWLLAVALSIPLAFVKVSTGILWAALVGYRALSVWGLSRRALLIVFLLAAALPYPLSVSVMEWGRLWDIFLGNSAPGSSAEPIQLFKYFRLWPSHTASALLPAGLFLVAHGLQLINADGTGGNDRAAARPYLETMLVVLGVGIPATALYLGGGDSFNFLAPAQWVGLIYLAALIESVRVFRFREIATRVGQYFAPAIIAIVGLLIFLMIGLKVLFSADRTIDAARSMISALKPQDPSGHANDTEFFRAFVENPFFQKLFDEAFSDALARSPGGRLERIANELLGENRKGVAAFVTPEQHAAWEIRLEVTPPSGVQYPWQPKICAEPFFVQALIGIPLLQGVPPFWRRCPAREFQYGYALNWRGLMVTDLDDASICRIARSKNVERVLILRNIEIPDRNRLLTCSS